MTHYLISFPSAAMDHIPPEELPAVSDAAHAVVQEIKDAGAYVFTGGIDESVAPVAMTDSGEAMDAGYPPLNGGMMIVDVRTREEALRWAAKIASACRCPQEVRQFMYDPAL